MYASKGHLSSFDEYYSRIREARDLRYVAVVDVLSNRFRGLAEEIHGSGELLFEMKIPRKETIRYYRVPPDFPSATGY